MSKSLILLLLILLFSSGDTDIRMSRLSTDEFQESFPMFYQNGVMFSSRELNDDLNSNISRMVFCEFDMSSNDYDSYKDPIQLTIAKGLFRFNCSPGDFDTNTNELYFTTNNLKADNDNIHNLSIAKGKIADFEIESIEYLNINNPNYSVAHPTLTEDGKTMIIGSDKDGDFDLYQYIRKDENNWKFGRKLTELENDFDQLQPNLINDTTLIFSSDHYLGQGGFDLYLTTKNSNGIWNKPTNLNHLNSDVDDYSYLPIDSQSGYICSNRQNDNKNIFYFTKKDE